jgi:hypothetical protein
MNENWRGMLQTHPANEVLNDPNVQPVRQIRITLTPIHIRMAGQVYDGDRLYCIEKYLGLSRIGDVRANIGLFLMAMHEHIQRFT